MLVLPVLHSVSTLPNQLLVEGDERLTEGDRFEWGPSGLRKVRRMKTFYVLERERSFSS
jgi:hypothetical protein